MEDFENLYYNIAKEIACLLERIETKHLIPDLDDTKFDFPEFNFNSTQNLKNIQTLEEALKEDLERQNDIFIKKTDVLKSLTNKVFKLDVVPYKNNLSKITKYDFKNEEMKKEIHLYSKIFIKNRAKLNKSKIETIYRPNKPSQKVLSTTGTEFNIPALIMNLINPSPDPMIYLEEKGGIIRNYSVSVVIDSSYSCFNPLSTSFSLQTLRILLSTLISVDLPCFDLIIARDTNPYVLCSNIGTVRALNYKSTLWESLFSILSVPCSKSDLASAIETVFDLKRLRPSESTSYLFVLTDGLFQENEHKRITRAVSNCVKSGVNVFCIGIGIYPIKIELLFPQVIYSSNPYNLNKGIANFFGESISGVKDTMFFLNKIEPNHSIKINNSITDVINNSKNMIFKKLNNELSSVVVETDAFTLFSNQEYDGQDSGKSIKTNPTGEGTELLKRNALKGQRILIVMLWSKTLNSDENECIHKQYLTEISPESEACLKDALDFYGIEIDIVENYRDAITKLTIDQEGKCPYYACWIINGPPFEILPDNSKEPFLLGQFLEVLKLFWEAGGALIFLAEGSELQYQTNEFLKILDFDGKKIEFHLVGENKTEGTKEHVGGKNLSGDRTGELKNNQSFSKKIERFGSIQRLRLDHNLFVLFEGDTISYTSTNDYEKLLPFHPFSRDSDGGISSLFYLSDEKKRGDIFIDCGFTKMFINMKKDDTAFRYFQNIAAWSARTNIHLFYDKIEPKEWRPNKIEYTISTDENKKWKKFKVITTWKTTDKKKSKTLFTFDHSASISGKSMYFKEIRRLVKKYYKEGDKFYLWDSNLIEKNRIEIDDWINGKNGSGGTHSELIAQAAKACPNHREHLLIVTDGKVNSSSIQKSDELMKQYNIQFQYVSVYVIGSGGDLSVGAPYCRGCPNKTVHVKSEKEREEMATLTQEQIKAFNSIPNISSYNEFIGKYNDIKTSINAKMLGRTNDQSIMSNLKSLKNKIIGGINGQDKSDFEEKWNELYKIAEKGIHDFSFGIAGIKRKK